MKRIWRISIMTYMLFEFTFFCHAQSSQATNFEELFNQGNSYYEKGEYEKAISEYEKILGAGYESGSLYYNLAGAYFKVKKIGKAVLNYERAKYLMPRDADLAMNARYAQASVNEKEFLPRGIWAWYPVRVYDKLFTIDELIWITSAVYLVTIILFFVLLLKGPGTYRLIIGALLFAFIIGNTVVIWRKINHIKTGAVVISSQANVHFGPFDSATKFFTLHEGAKIKILKAKDEWYKVKRHDGKVGWLKQETVERI